MSDNPLQSLFRRFQTTFQLPEDSVVVYGSANRAHFDAYPVSYVTDAFAMHLPELCALFAVQITGPSIHAAIEMA